MVLVTVASADDGTTAPQVLAKLTAEHLSRLELIWGDSMFRIHHLNSYLERSGAKYRIVVVSRPVGSVG